MLDEKKSPQVEVEDGKQQKQQTSLKEDKIHIDSDSKTDKSTKFSSETSQDSPVLSCDRSQLADENNSFSVEEEMPSQNREKFENYSLPSLYHILLNKKSKKQDNREKMNESATSYSSFSFSTSSSSSQSSFTKGKSNSTGASGVLRNLITCGGVDSNDAVLVMLNKANNTGLKKSDGKACNEAEICRVDSLRESASSFETSWNYQQQQQHGVR